MITSQEIEILFFEIGMTRDGAAAARVAHNHEVPGSSPGPATKKTVSQKCGAFFLASSAAFPLNLAFILARHIMG